MTSDLRERVARAIELEIQLHDFGHIKDGQFVTSVGQIELLSECCNKAAVSAILAIAPDIRNDALREAAEECQKQLPQGEDEFTKGYRLACEENARNILALRKDAEE